MNDHAKQAAGLLRQVVPGMDTYTAQALTTSANAQATLALAYEQRTANLIALFNVTEDDAHDLVKLAGRNFYPEIADEIFTRLNITKES